MSNKETQTPEKRSFRISPNMIYSIIEAQAGTLGKGLLELVQNSCDASATEIRITLDRNGFTAADNGQGFAVINEIEEYFEVFGFKHEQGDYRKFGRYGAGRGQVFSWAKTLWRTATFSMEVDTLNCGLDYELKKDLSHHDGCTITGDFYEQQMPSDVENTIRELKEMAKYCPIKVYLNDHLISTNPKDVKWDIETDDAYIKLKSTGLLHVYNQGIYVRGYSQHQMGTGGTVVSKKELQVNFARNDVLLSKCRIWKKLRQFLQADTNKKTVRKPRLTEGERENMIAQFVSKQLTYDQVKDAKLIKDAQGRFWPLSRLESLREITVSPEEGSRLADRLHQRKLSWVVSPITLELFSCDSGEDFVELLRNLSKSDKYSYSPIKLTFKPFDQFNNLMNDGYEVLKEKDLTKQEQYVLSAINKSSYLFRARISELGYPSKESRVISAGVSDVAEAWTNGIDRIVLNRPLLKLANEGYAGFLKIAMVIAHEYCHDDADTGSHVHDMEFYEKFHNIVIDTESGPVALTTKFMLDSYAQRCRKNNCKVVRKIINAEDRDAEIQQYPEIQAAAS